MRSKHQIFLYLFSFIVFGLSCMSCSTIEQNSESASEWTTNIQGLRSLLQFIEATDEIQNKRIVSIVYVDSMNLQIITGSTMVGDVYRLRWKEDHWEVVGGGMWNG